MADVEDIFIIGAGGFAKEVAFLIEEINRVSKSKYRINAFIDRNVKENDCLYVNGENIRVIDEQNFSENYTNRNINLAFGIGTPEYIKNISERFSERYFFPNLIHPGFIGDLKGIRFGKGNIVTAGCIFTTNIEIGNFNVFNLHTTVGHDCIIRNCNVINPGTNISGGVVIGDNNLIGTNATVLQYKMIGNNNIVGAGTLVNKNIENDSVMVGIPARKIR